ncbi:MAG: thioredoxin [Bacteroidales bacterium]
MKKTILTLITVLSLTIFSGQIHAQTVKTLNKQEFIEKIMDYQKNTDKWVFKGDKPVIIDFYAKWCGPCKQVAPIMEELAKEYGTQIIIYKVDTDKEKELARDFGIQSIPTMLFIPVVGSPQVSKGALPKESLKKLIDEFLLQKNK